MTTFTSRNVPLVEGTDPADIAARVNPVAQLAHDRPGVSALTTTQRNALTDAELWDGRVILNTTTDRLNRYDLGTTSWVAIADFSEIAALLATSGTPAQDAVTGSRGVSTSAARADHVHPWPAWQAYTPILGGTSSVGSTGTLQGRWVQLGETVHFWARATFGGTGISLASGVQLTLPVTRAASGPAFGAGTLIDNGSNFYAAGVNMQFDRAQLYVIGTSGAAVAITGTSPFTWVATDYAEVSGTYEAN